MLHSTANNLLSEGEMQASNANKKNTSYPEGAGLCDPYTDQIPQLRERRVILPPHNVCKNKFQLEPVSMGSMA